MSQQWHTFAVHNTGNIIWITRHGDTQQCRDHKRVPSNIHLVYTKGLGKVIHKPTTLYKISLLSQLPQTWVFQKSGSVPVTGVHKPSQYTTFPNKKRNLQNITRVQEKVLRQGIRKSLATDLRKGNLMGASDGGSVKDGKGLHAWIITSGTDKALKTMIK